MLKGQVALITGGSRGIGRAIALKLAADGADIAVIYASEEEKARQVCAEATKLGVKAAAYRCNVADFAAAKEVVASVISDFGRLDILVNNAGVTKDGLILGMKEQDFDVVMDTNLKGAFNMIKHASAYFIKKRKGRIINITSVIGLMGNAGQANYAASKAGLIGLTKSVARELAGRGICCNAVAPGFIRTDMTAALGEDSKLMSMIPLGRVGEADDVADLVVFLAGEKAGYITGEVIRVDGGMAM